MTTAAVYARVSTADQDVEHQRENLLDYADRLGLEVVDVLADKSTGTDTDRDGYRELMKLVENGAVDAVVVRSITRISRNMRDLHRTIGTVVEDNNCGLYVRNDDLEIEAGGEMDMRDKILLNTLAMAAELEADMIRQRVLDGLRAAEEAGKWTSRPPFGFTTSEDGFLQPTDDFDRAVQAIMAVEEKGWSHRKASRHTGVPRRTIPALLERKEMYLDDFDG
jgi:DNA invertase Pin-like site-specific DNA recombinase